jgi:hypothetical protein
MYNSDPKQRLLAFGAIDFLNDMQTWIKEVFGKE